MAEAWIVDAVRTPRGKGRPDGALHGVHPQELLAQCLRAVAARVGFDPLEVDDVVAGNGLLMGDHGDDIARMAVLLAGWPETVPGMTLHRFCGSGQNAVTVAGMGVGSGAQDLVVAGGVESMSRWGVAVGAPTIDGGNPDLRALFPTVPQGISADLIATLEGFTREDLDAFAAESQRRAAVAMAEGRFERGIVAVTDPAGGHAAGPRRASPPLDNARGSRQAATGVRGDGHVHRQGRDAHLRRAVPAAVRGVDHIEHVHHAGNSSGVVDGAAAVVVASDRWVGANGVTPRARIRATAAIGSEPVIMLTAPARPPCAVWPRPTWRSATSTCGRSTRPSPSCR